MTPWLTFLIGSLLLTLVIVGGLLLPRRKRPPAAKTQKLARDTSVLYLLLWLASLSMMAYIAFAFGKR